MAYSEFLNLKQVEKKLGLNTTDLVLFPFPVPCVAISSRLQEDIVYAKKMPLLSEKAKSELVIAPILREIKTQILTIFQAIPLMWTAVNL
jgi:hypothetical protein